MGVRYSIWRQNREAAIGDADKLNVHAWSKVEAKHQREPCLNNNYD